MHAIAQMRDYLTSWRHRHDGVVLVYHEVDPCSHGFSARRHNVAPAILHEQLRMLRRIRTIVSVDEFFSRVKEGRPLSGLAAITFDDAYASAVHHGLRVVRDLGLPATVFVATSFAEGAGFWRDDVRWISESGYADSFVRELVGLGFDWAQALSASDLYKASKDPAIVPTLEFVGQLHAYLARHALQSPRMEGRYAGVDMLQEAGASGIRFGNHTHRHLVMAGLSADDQTLEIQTAAERIRSWGLEASGVFAMPFGSPQSYNSTTFRVAGELGYEGVVLSGAKIRFATDIPAHLRQSALPAAMRFMPSSALPLLS